MIKSYIGRLYVLSTHRAKRLFSYYVLKYFQYIFNEFLELDSQSLESSAK